MRLHLDDRVVLITGGAAGIGRACAEAARRRGARVALVDRDARTVTAAAAAIGDGTLGVAADVCDLDALEAAVAQVVDRLGGLDVVIANAGVGPVATTVAHGDRVHQRHVLDVNLHGVWHTAWATAGHVAACQGHLVLVSSIAAFTVTPAWAAYSASKAAVEQLGRSLRVELAPSGATAGVVHFGLVDTGLVRGFEADPLSRALEHLAPGFITRTITPACAAEALLRGVERRHARTVHPAWWRVPYALRGVTGPLSDALLARDPRVHRLMRAVAQRDQTPTTKAPR